MSHTKHRGAHGQHGKKRSDPPIVVDGSNIAYLDRSPDGKPTVAAVERVRKRLIALGYRPIVIVDAALYHQAPDSDLLDTLVDEGVIYQAPAGTDADYFVLETARRGNARIVTDDQYLDHRDRFPDAEERRVPVMIVDGNVEFYHLEPAAKDEHG